MHSADWNRLFAREIEAKMAAERVSAHTTTLKVANSSIEVRLLGAAITGLNLDGQPILYTPPDLEVAKLSASHAMSPVGPNEGLGGQHGVPRWADYHVFGYEDVDDPCAEVSLQAKRSDMGLSIVRGIRLGERTVWLRSELQNNGPGKESGSLGEHLYFYLPEEHIDGLMINSVSIDDYLGSKGALAEIMAGKAHFTTSFGRGPTTVIEFPDGRKIRLKAASDVRDSNGNRSKAPHIGMLIWHKPGTESICFEPTLGFSNDGVTMRNDLLNTPPHGQARLNTSISILS